MHCICIYAKYNNMKKNQGKHVDSWYESENVFYVELEVI